MKILITGARAPSTLELIRNLSYNGNTVYAADTLDKVLSAKSKYVETYYVISSPVFDLNGFKESLIKIIVESSIDVLVPTCEEVFYVALIKDELSKYCMVFCDSVDKLLLLHDKAKFLTWIDSIGLITPKTIVVTSVEDIKKYKYELGSSKIVLKPVYSRFSDKVLIIKNSSLDYESLAGVISETCPYVIQEYIDGEQFCVYASALQGKLTLFSVYGSIVTAGLGANLVFKAIKNPELQDFVLKVVETLNFTGNISFDFIQDRQNRFYPIECNPRLTSGIHLFSKRKTDLTLLFVKNDGILFPTARCKKTMKLALLVVGFKTNRLSKVLYNLLTAKNLLFDLNDLPPFLTQISSYMEYVSLARKHNISVLEVSTYDIRFDYEDYIRLVL